MKRGLIGHTGFVGANLCTQTNFHSCFNSSSIHLAKQHRWDMLVCAAPHSLKWWANANPSEDQAMVKSLIGNLTSLRTDVFVLIATIDAFPKIQGVDEDFDCTTESNHPYGKHRLELEIWARNHYPNCLIVRLPNLFGPLLKKNVIFDILNNHEVEKINGASTLQWYDISRLWKDIEICLKENIPLVMLANEPVDNQRIAETIDPRLSLSVNSESAIHYDVHTKYAEIFGGHDHYIEDADCILNRISVFAEQAKPEITPQ